MIRATTLFVLSAALSASASAEQPSAPLPPGYASSGETPLHGLYAEVSGLSSIFDERELEALTSACEGKGKAVSVEEANLRNAGATRIYRTADSVAVIQDRATLRLDAETCVARYTLDRQVTIKRGRWSYDEVPGFSSPALPCDRDGRRSRCKDETIAGLVVTCIDEGDGLVGSFRCVSRRQDISRGLLASYGTYVDDDSSPTGSWALQQIQLDALIDPAVFRDSKP